MWLRGSASTSLLIAQNRRAGSIVPRRGSATENPREPLATCTGSAAANVVKGGGGNDTISGGLGLDTLQGDGGRDSFLFNTTPSAGNVDTVTDFRAGFDKIVLDGGVFSALPAGPVASGNFRSNGTATPLDANDYLLYSPTSGKLFYDPTGNGSGTTDRVQIATLSQVNGLFPVLTAADITVTS